MSFNKIDVFYITSVHMHVNFTFNTQQVALCVFLKVVFKTKYSNSFDLKCKYYIYMLVLSFWGFTRYPILLFQIYTI